MRFEAFTEKKTGKLFRITLGHKKDWGFIPDSLSSSWSFPVELWPLLADAKEALGTLNGIGQILPDPQLLLRPLQSREAIASSNIEGTYVSPEQLLLYQLDPREPKAADDEAYEWREVFNYKLALERGCEQLKSLPICNRVIRDMHETLMTGVRGRNKAPGEFRKWQVQIGSKARYVPPASQDVDALMNDLEKFINAPAEGLDPLVRAYLVHYQFEAIHPFGDGNGRVGRALLALMIYKWLNHSHPWLYMSAYFEKLNDEYVENMFNISADGRWHDWIEYCLRGTILAAKDSIRRCHEFKKLRAEFMGMVDNHTSRTYPLIDYLFEGPVITVTAVAKNFAVAYQTARDDIMRLCEAGILTEIEGYRPRSFGAPRIMHIAYGDSPGGAETEVDE